VLTMDPREAPIATAYVGSTAPPTCHLAVAWRFGPLVRAETWRVDALAGFALFN
jgi:hypothetical protein